VCPFSRKGDGANSRANSEFSSGLIFNAVTVRDAVLSNYLFLRLCPSYSQAVAPAWQASNGSGVPLTFAYVLLSRRDMQVEVGQIVLLCLAAFSAGFIDAIVGGGGLIQTPASLVILSAHPVASVLGTVKVPSFLGTATAASQYLRKVPVRWRLLGWLCATAFVFSFLGSRLLLHLSNAFMKPLLLVVLVAVAAYTYMKKDFGQHKHRVLSKKNELLYAVAISAAVGFYDGFIGPGTGSFFVLLFIAVLGFDFLGASAHAKIVNVATNLGSIFLFVMQGKILWAAAVPMAISNAAGAAIGAQLAMVKGNKFIRIFFLIVVIGTLVRLGYDVFFK
jgi:uncharacterized membrane protein YfcA